jgi:hypothetical protein
VDVGPLPEKIHKRRKVLVAVLMLTALMLLLLLNDRIPSIEIGKMQEAPLAA